MRLTGGAPSPSGADPTGHSLLLRARFPEIYAKTTVILEPVDYLGLRFTGRAAATPASMIASWLTDNRLGAPLGYVDSLVARTRRDRAACPSCCRPGPCSARCCPRSPASSAWRPGRPSSAACPTCTPPWWARAPWRPTRATSPSRRHPGWARACPSSARRVPPDRHRAGSRSGPPGGGQQPGDRRGGAALAARADHRLAQGLDGGGSGIGAEGAAAEGLAPGSTTSSASPLARRPAARACCSCPG